MHVRIWRMCHKLNRKHKHGIKVDPLPTVSMYLSSPPAEAPNDVQIMYKILRSRTHFARSTLKLGCFAWQLPGTIILLESITFPSPFEVYYRLSAEKPFSALGTPPSYKKKC